jgi:15-cis-phytoene synthase
MLSKPDAIDEVANAARSGEPERYLAALLADDPRRQDLLAIAAFAAELARIPALVTEPMMGEVRLQWWRDVLQAPANRDNAGPAVAAAIRTAQQRHRLSMPLLLAMTEARAFDLYADPMPDQAAFDGYLDKSAGAPFALALRVLGAEAPAALADHAGRAYGRVRVLCALPHWLSRGRNPLPQPLLDEVDGARDQLVAGQWGPASQRGVARVVEEARLHLEAAQRLARDLPREKRIALLPLATIRPYLDGLGRRQHNPLRSVTDIAPLTRIVRIGWAHWSGL